MRGTCRKLPKQTEKKRPNIGYTLATKTFCTYFENHQQSGRKKQKEICKNKLLP